MANLKLKNPSGGSLNLVSADSASDLTVTFPATTGTAMVSGNMPAFSAYSNANQTVSNGVQTKVQLNTELFDTASCFNNTGSTVGGIPSYSFRPNVAGYYQFNIIGGATASSSLTFNYMSLAKNGEAVNLAVYGPYAGTSSYGSLTALIYLNGTTDYVELYIRVDGSGTLSINGSTPPAISIMSASLVRAA
jgi:hypothetical protein